MKKVLLTAFAVMASLSLFAQGTIDFKNSTATSVMLQNADTTVVKAPINAYAVGLWWAPAGTTDEAAFTFLAGSTTKIFPAAGIFSGGTKTIAAPFVGGTAIAAQVRGWDFSLADYGSALAAGKATGKSTIFAMTTGAPNGSPPTNPQGFLGVGQFTGLTLAVPEPSTIALGLLGLAGLFVLRRRS